MDFLDRIDKSLNNFRRELFAKVDATLKGTEYALSKVLEERKVGEERIILIYKGLED